MSKRIRSCCQNLGDPAKLPRGGSVRRAQRRWSPIHWVVSLAILFTLDSVAQSQRNPGDPNGRQGVPGQVQLPGPREDQERNGKKNLSGQVADKQGKGLAQAVVYLKNKKTLEVKTFISNDQGNYRFNSLDEDTDYAVHAEYRGAMSRERSVSLFDDRKEVYLLLEIDTSKQ